MLIIKTNVTSRPMSDNEQETLSSLQLLNPGWEYVGVVGNLKLFKLSVVKE